MKSILPIRIFRVAERSMEPGIAEGSYVVVNCLARRYAPGDVVVLKSPESSSVLIKRIKMIAGGRLFVVGDNRDISRDSRSFGAVRPDSIIGKMMFVI